VSTEPASQLLDWFCNVFLEHHAPVFSRTPKCDRRNPRPSGIISWWYVPPTEMRSYSSLAWCHSATGLFLLKTNRRCVVNMVASSYRTGRKGYFCTEFLLILMHRAEKCLLDMKREGRIEEAANMWNDQECGGHDLCNRVSPLCRLSSAYFATQKSAREYTCHSENIFFVSKASPKGDRTMVDVSQHHS